jgi:3-hydroxy-9,10-secoandrosta-1,3,5(10)-triene-9,17-dione monooxygenase
MTSTAATEPLTPEALIDNARQLAPLLKAHSEETERLTHIPDVVHQACIEAGIYRCYIPRRYGGLEFDVPTFMAVCRELGRGDPSGAWCIALAAAHALQVASWWPESAQDEIFGGEEFRAASVAAPIGPARRVGDEWELTGKVAYCSGIPLSNHYMGQALIAGEDGTPTDRMLLFVARSEDFEILDDWGRLMGLKGTGSNAITFDHARIPAHWAIEDGLMIDRASELCTGYEIHGNPMYSGRSMSCFTLTLAAVAIGGAYAMLDEYEEMLRTKLTPLPPMVPRLGDETFQRWYGSALAKIATADAAVRSAADQHMENCRRAAEDRISYTYGEDQRIGCIAREAVIQAWEVCQAEIFRTAGSSAATDGTRFERLFRDMAMLNSHRNTVLREFAFGEMARDVLGLPRLGIGNVQDPHQPK